MKAGGPVGVPSSDVHTEGSSPGPPTTAQAVQAAPQAPQHRRGGGNGNDAMGATLTAVYRVPGSVLGLDLPECI